MQTKRIGEPLRCLRGECVRSWGNWKGLIVLVCFRGAQFFYRIAQKTKFLWIVIFPLLIAYRIFIEWILCVEIPWGCDIGPGLIIDHGQGVVINKEAVIGSNCRLRNGVVIGCKVKEDGELSRSPLIGNNVDIGACALIIGDISIGDNVVIGAGSVVVKSVAANSIVAGNPARLIRIKS